MAIGFLHPEALWLLPLALLPLFPAGRRALAVSSLEPLAALPRSWSERLQPFQRWLAALTLLVLVLAFAGPEYRERTRQTLRQGIDLMLALDISASMASGDIEPDRLGSARTAAADFLQSRRHDRIGVILFSGTPYLLAPPTMETAPIVARLRSLRPDRPGSGTAIGDALAAALGRLEASAAASRAVILLTDGTSNRGRITPLAAARAAATLGVRVYTIGFGTGAGTRTSVAPAGESPALQHDPLDEDTLRSIAGLTGGRYFRATDSDSLAAVYRHIDGLEKSPLVVREHLTVTPLQPWLLLVGGIFATLELLLYRVWLRIVP